MIKWILDHLLHSANHIADLTLLFPFYTVASRSLLHNTQQKEHLIYQSQRLKTIDRP